MAKIKEFSFKNVRSYGNKMTSIPFDMENGLVLIQGKNGFGKTSICEALEYGIYGKSSRVKSKNLPNWLNDNMFTSVKFITEDNRTVSLSRGIAPDFFQLDIDNGKTIDSKDKKSDNVSTKPRLDKLVEEELFGIPFEVFSNNILLSIEDFKSFINMQVSDKRRIIDKIFDTDIFNDMMKKLKEEIKVYKEKQTSLNSSAATKEEILNSTIQRIEEIKATIDDTKEETIEKLKSLINDLSSQIKSLSDESDNVSKIISENNKQIQDILLESNNLESKIRDEFSNLISNFENSLNSEYTDECNRLNQQCFVLKDERTKKYNELVSSIPSVENKVQSITNEIDVKINSLTSELNEKVNSIEQSKNNAENALKTKIEDRVLLLQEEYKKKNDELNKSLSDYTSELNNIEQSLFNERNKVEQLNVKYQLLQNKLSLYENHKCPQCGVDLEHTEFHVNQKQELTNELSSITQNVSILNATISEFEAAKQDKVAAIDLKKKEIYDLEIKFNSDKSDLSKSYSEKLIELNELLNKKVNEINDFYKPEIARLSEQKSNIISNAQSEYNNEISRIKSEYEKDIHFYETDCNDKKQTKFNDISSSLKVKKLEAQSDCDLKIKQLNESVVNRKNSIQTSIDENQNKLNDLISKITSFTDQKNERLIELAKIEVGDNRQLLNELVGIAEKTENELNDTKAELDDVNYELSIRENTEFLIGDNGLKKMIMRKILPSFNATISEMTTLFDFKYRFIFDDNFDAHLSLCGKEVPVSTSRGEEKIMDIIILLSTLQLILMKHPSINMLFLDEIFSNLDVENIAKAVGILKDYARKYNLTIFVMSHTTVPQEMFDQIIEVTSDGMFSELKIIK